MKGKVYKIKEGKLDAWKEWGVFLMGSKEAHKTLREEGLSAEYFYIFEIDGAHYTLGGGIQFQKGLIDRESEINKLHMLKKKECLTPVGDAELAYILLCE